MADPESGGVYATGRRGCCARRKDERDVRVRSLLERVRNGSDIVRLR